MKTEMKWANLKNNNCPYCGSKMLEQNGDTHKCSKCMFKIEHERLTKILEHRSNPLRSGIIKMKWQNLKIGRCPLCGDHLNKAIGQYEVSQCVSINCTFHIREDRMQRILTDAQHPANNFPV